VSLYPETASFTSELWKRRRRSAGFYRKGISYAYLVRAFSVKAIWRRISGWDLLAKDEYGSPHALMLSLMIPSRLCVKKKWDLGIIPILCAWRISCARWFQFYRFKDPFEIECIIVHLYVHFRTRFVKLNSSSLNSATIDIKKRWNITHHCRLSFRCNVRWNLVTCKREHRNTQNLILLRLQLWD